MSEQITAEVVTESDETTAAPEPTPTTDTPPTQIEEETPAEEATETPAGEATEPAPLPEVEATVGHDQTTGKYLVSITTRHPDPTVVAVNGRAVWEGNG